MQPQDSPIPQTLQYPPFDMSAGAMPDRATDTCYASNTLLKASPLFGTVIGCFLMKSAFATSLV